MSEKTVMLLDGGMGQELLKRSGSKPTAMWSAQVMLDQPDIVKGLHADFIKAGARAITLNTYSVTPERLARDADESFFPRLQNAAIRAAIEARDQAGIEGVRIAGCLPPLVASYRPDQAPEFDVMLDTYKRIVEAQAKDVDYFLCETMSSTLESTASMQAASESGLPVWIALSVADDDSGLLRSGDDLTEAVAQLEKMGAHAILLNCSKPESINAAWAGLRSGSGRVGAYANGFTSIAALEPGGTVDSISARHDLGPGDYADVAMNWIDNGAVIVGGCCEVGPEHIAHINLRLQQANYTVGWPE